MTRLKTTLAAASSPAPSATRSSRTASTTLRSSTAWFLMSASAALDHLAQRLVIEAAPTAPLPGDVEFYAQAGAPEGAVYVDGHLVGWLKGVSRL